MARVGVGGEKKKYCMHAFFIIHARVLEEFFFFFLNLLFYREEEEVGQYLSGLVNQKGWQGILSEIIDILSTCTVGDDADGCRT